MKLFFFFFVFTCASLAQDFGMGVMLDDSLYMNSPKSAPLMRGDFMSLPPAVSFKEYCPTPGNQGMTPTCVGWAVSYSGRTLLEAIKNNWSRETADKNTYSPSFIYNQVRPTNDCSRGASLLDALDVLKEQGDVPLNDFEFDCDREVNEKDINSAADHRIIEYRLIFNRKEKNKCLFAKKSLSESKPVIIAMDCPQSFQSASELWKPDSTDYVDLGRGHCLTVVGYDDEKFGGAFEILNSWGTNWGKQGYTYVKYTDFDFFAKLGFEIIDAGFHNQAAPDLSGSLRFVQDNGDTMKIKFNGSFFEMMQPYNSGTKFKLILTNNEPAFIYAFGSDTTNKCTKLFPFEDKMSAYLPYKNNHVAIPGEDYSCMLDEKAGTSYFCFLYSKKEIAVDSLLNKLEQSRGGMWERIETLFKQDAVAKHNINYKDGSELSFDAKSVNRSVVPILIKINHENK